MQKNLLESIMLLQMLKIATEEKRKHCSTEYLEWKHTNLKNTVLKIQGEISKATISEH